MAPERLVFLFPGLGAYSEGMLRRARKTHPGVDEVFQEIDEAAETLGVAPVSQWLFDGPPSTAEDLFTARLEGYHLAIFGTSVAVHRILTTIGTQPTLLVGHSFGEIAALVAAGAFDVADGTRLVCARVSALAPWRGLGGMAALGADQDTAAHLIGLIDEPDLVIACHNAARQTVLAGPLPAVAHAEEAAGALGMPFTRLRVPYASHHPALRPAVDDFLAATSAIRQRPLRLPVHSPIHRRRYTGGDDLRRALADNLVLPLAFADTIRELHAKGFTHFVEAGARAALTRCVTQTVPGARTFAPLADDELDGLDAAAQFPARATTPTPTAVSEDRTGTTATGSACQFPAVQPLDRTHVLARLRELYARALEYPPELVTDDALLEAELGIDSLKQTSLLTEAFAEFGMDHSPTRLRPRDLPTLAGIADYVTGQEQAR